MKPWPSAYLYYLAYVALRRKLTEVACYFSLLVPWLRHWCSLGRRRKRGTTFQTFSLPVFTHSKRFSFARQAKNNFSKLLAISNVGNRTASSDTFAARFERKTLRPSLVHTSLSKDTTRSGIDTYVLLIIERRNKHKKVTVLYHGTVSSYHHKIGQKTAFVRCERGFPEEKGFPAVEYEISHSLSL